MDLPCSQSLWLKGLSSEVLPVLAHFLSYP